MFDAQSLKTPAKHSCNNSPTKTENGPMVQMTVKEITLK